MPSRFSPVIVSAVAIIALTVGCARNGATPDPGSSPSPLSPSTVSSGSAPGGASTAATRGLPDRIVTMMDACDPDTFNAPPPAGVGPGTCSRSGGVQFATFLEQLGKHGTIGAWHFAPPDTSAAVGQVFVAMNRGGEVHTFTEVETFGGWHRFRHSMTSVTIRLSRASARRSSPTTSSCLVAPTAKSRSNTQERPNFSAASIPG